MRFIDWFKKPFKKPFIIEGRASRSEYWYFYFGKLFISLVLLGMSSLVNNPIMFYILYICFHLFVIIPTFTVSIRRLHDTNRSGLNLLWGLFPIVGTFYLLILFASPSDQGENEYGILDEDMKTSLPPTLFKNKEKERNFDFN